MNGEAAVHVTLVNPRLFIGVLAMRGNFRTGFTRFVSSLACFLAAGTWILPAGIGFVTAATPASAVPIAAASQENPWIGSEVEIAWRAATGHSTDMQSSVLLITDGASDFPLGLSLYDLEVEQVVQGSEVGWIPLGAFELLSDFGAASDSDGSSVGATVVVRMIAGTVLGVNGDMGHFVGAAVEGSAAMSAGSEQASSSAGLFFPIHGFATAELASSHLAGLEAAAANPQENLEWPGCGDGSAGINCFNPNWVGNNGWQCCRDQMCRDQMLAHCDKMHAHEMNRCVYVTFLGASAVLGTCVMTKCKWAWFFPPLMKHCLAACLGLSVITGYAAMMACLEEAAVRREQCRGEANRWYYETLRATGCDPKPSASPTALLEIISEQEELLGDGLVKSSEG